MSAESPSNISPNPLEVIPKRTTFEIIKKKTENATRGGRHGGVSESFLGLISPYFVRINPF
jgi:hypothetical protein